MSKSKANGSDQAEVPGPIMVRINAKTWIPRKPWETPQQARDRFLGTHAESFKAIKTKKLEPGEEKMCQRCKLPKDYDKFHMDRRSADGKADTCTDCITAALTKKRAAKESFI